jgi:hypothetical protein
MILLAYVKNLFLQPSKNIIYSSFVLKSTRGLIAIFSKINLYNKIISIKFIKWSDKYPIGENY